MSHFTERHTLLVCYSHPYSGLRNVSNSTTALIVTIIFFNISSTFQNAVNSVCVRRHKGRRTTKQPSQVACCRTVPVKAASCLCILCPFKVFAIDTTADQLMFPANASSCKMMKVPRSSQGIFHQVDYVGSLVRRRPHTLLNFNPAEIAEKEIPIKLRE
ncbi:hypothetical protein BaRGS_00010052 [Batillaria attramentaria]|uniref:Uncharacterized protein n=1 Tax=Batillaria attramentaria TaxID=370345 RepID=A0ABD0LGX8_9CAEN